MAKRRERQTAQATEGESQQPQQSTETSAAGEESQAGALGDFAEDLGRILGSAQRKASTWLSQRTTILEQLTNVRDTASQLIQQLTGGEGKGDGRRGAARRGRRPGGGAQQTPSAPAEAGQTGQKRRTMSAEARRRISEAQKARWAAQRSGGGKAKK